MSVFLHLLLLAQQLLDYEIGDTAVIYCDWVRNSGLGVSWVDGKSNDLWETKRMTTTERENKDQIRERVVR